MNSSENKKDKENGSNIFISALCGAFFSLVISLIILLVFCIIGYYSGDSDKYYRSLTFAAFIIGGFVAGFIAVKRYGKAPVVAGFSGGIAYMLLIIIPSIFIENTSGGILSSAFSCAIMLVLSLAGGLCGRKKEKQPRRSAKINFKKFR